MTVAVIDTLKFAKRLKDEGMEPRLAEATAAAINEALSDQVASKADLDVLESRVTTAIASARNAQIIWTVGAVFGLGIIQHFIK